MSVYCIEIREDGEVCVGSVRVGRITLESGPLYDFVGFWNAGTPEEIAKLEGEIEHLKGELEDANAIVKPAKKLADALSKFQEVA